MQSAESLSLRTIAARLTPGVDLRDAIERLGHEHHVEAGCILSAVGSLRSATLRLAGADTYTKLDGPFEIVSLSGTLSPDGPHLHLSIAAKDGRTIGGHLVPGCTVYTTVEVVVADLAGVRFARLPDAMTGYRELNIGGGSRH
ncbi:MAG TPA: PPC domain-containing DNA-binding protein [Burkholderiales bacterium]|jgi:predicted DNA-binding protein with PD1-like motif|nr:PPC domain-containing DNA-binding protein [Burkholderiales bacterium]